MPRHLQIIIVLIVLVIVFLFFGVLFFDTEENPEDPFFGEQVPTEDPFVDADGDGEITQETSFYTLQVSYPTDDTPGAERVQTFIADETRAFVAQAEVDSAELEGTVFEGTYTLDIQYEMYQTGNVTSYVVNEYQYTGGANGIATVETFVMDDTGAEVSLGTIVPQDRRGALVGALQTRLRELNDIQAGAEGVFADAINGITFESLEDFYVTPTELVVAFSEYEVAPGAAGVVEVRFPLNEYTNL